MQQKPVQHYRYSSEQLNVVKEDEAYFVKHFEPWKEPDVMHWLNFHSMADKETVMKICDRIGIDKMIQEDLFVGTKRPRLEEFSDYIFFSIISALPIARSEFELKKERISFIVGPNYLISFQERVSDHFPEVRERLEMKKGKICHKGPDFLLYRMLEAIVDNYSEVLDEIAGNIERLEALMIRRPKSEVLQKVEWQKRKLVELRKITMPMRELVSQIERAENTIFDDANDHYFLELKDFCTNVIEEIEGQRQVLEGVSNLYYAVQGQKMNEIMKVLTVTSAVFAPLTFIVGVYGMNFENMPELKWKYGYFMAIALMVVIAVALLFIFIKRGWLRRNN